MADEPAFRGPYDHANRGRPYFEAPLPEPQQEVMPSISPEDFGKAVEAATPEPEPEA